MDGWHGVFPATPAAEGVPHGGMGGARTDGEHPVTGPILKKKISITDLEMLPVRVDASFLRKGFFRLQRSGQSGRGNSFDLDFDVLR